MLISIMIIVVGFGTLQVPEKQPAPLGTDGLPAPLRMLVSAYPGIDPARSTPHLLVWKDGAGLAFGKDQPDRTYDERLAHATLWDQMSLPYPKGWPYPIPKENEDPGRLRCEAFFRKVYGDSRAAIERNLTSVPWPPAGKGKTVAFTSINGAAEALRRAGEELARLGPDVQAYVVQPNGTYNWRTIAGAGRLSPHSFGIAIDFAIPGWDRHYWRWTDGNGAEAPAYPASVLEDERMRRIVEVFEKHGFIWGGKWRHYDFVHFEYRPELLP